MDEPIQSSAPTVDRWLIAFRLLIYTALILSVTVLWGETSRQSMKSITQGLPLEAAAVCGVLLVLSSLVFWKRLGRWAAYGLAAGIWTAVTCLIPTMD